MTAGASNDFEKATEIARNMVCYLGMSKKLGPLTYGQRQQLQFLGSDYTEQRNRPDIGGTSRTPIFMGMKPIPQTKAMSSAARKSRTGIGGG